MTQINSRIIVPIISAVSGLLWLILGIAKYGWWVDNRPGSGFFPAIIGALLIFVSIIAFFSERKNSSSPGYILAHLYPFLAAGAVIASAMLIGFFPALLIYIVAWLRLYERYSWKFSLTTGAITIAALYGIFYVWLRIPVPQGYLFNVITG